MNVSSGGKKAKNNGSCDIKERKSGEPQFSPRDVLLALGVGVKKWKVVVSRTSSTQQKGRAKALN